MPRSTQQVLIKFHFHLFWGSCYPWLLLDQLTHLSGDRRYGGAQSEVPTSETVYIYIYMCVCALYIQ